MWRTTRPRPTSVIWCVCYLGGRLLQLVLTSRSMDGRMDCIREISRCSSSSSCCLPMSSSSAWWVKHAVDYVCILYGPAFEPHAHLMLGGTLGQLDSQRARDEIMESKLDAMQQALASLIHTLNSTPPAAPEPAAPQDIDSISQDLLSPSIDAQSHPSAQALAPSIVLTAPPPTAPQPPAPSDETPVATSTIILVILAWLVATSVSYGFCPVLFTMCLILPFIPLRGYIGEVGGADKRGESCPQRHSPLALTLPRSGSPRKPTKHSSPSPGAPAPATASSSCIPPRRSTPGSWASW
jgi:hypothetical protein